MKKSLFLLLLIVNTGLLSAQSKKDSLTRVINTTPGNDSARITAALQLGRIYLEEQDSTKSADNYFKALQISRAANNQKGTIKALTQIGYLNELTQNADKALKYYQEAIQYGNKHQILPDLALAYSYVFFIHSHKSSYKTAILYGDSAYVIFKKLNRTLDMANQLNNIGLMYNKLNLNKEAISYYQRALTLYNDLGPAGDAKKTSTILNIGLVFQTLKSHDQALKYYQEGYQLAVKTNNTKNIIEATNNIGNVYWAAKDYKKAYTYYFKNLEPSRKTNDPITYGIAIANVANLLTDMKDKQAEKYYQLAFKQNEISGNTEGLVSNYINYARFLGESGQLKLADDYLQKGMRLADKNNMATLKQAIFESMAEIQKREKDYEKAYALQDSALRLKDVVLNPNTNKEVAKLNIQYQTERKEKELAKNKATIAQNELQLQQRNNQLYIALLGLVIIGGGASYFISASRNKQKRLRQQHEFNLQLAGAEARNQLQEEKLRISRELHDNIGSQLTFINAAMQNMEGDKIDADAVTQTRQLTQNTIADLRRTVWLINKEEVDLDEFVIKLRDYVKPLQYKNPQFKIEVQYSGNCNLPSLTATHLFRVIQEGLNNALKYAQADLMHVSLNVDGPKLAVQIKDNGIGFDRNTVSEGHGLKNMNARAEALNGTCIIASAPGKGSTISLTIPV